MVERTCRLLGYSRQAFYQKSHVTQQLFIEAELILQQVHKIRSRHPRVGTRKLHKMLEPFLKEHQILTASFSYPTPQDAPVTRLVVSSLHTPNDLDILAARCCDFVGNKPHLNLPQ